MTEVLERGHERNHGRDAEDRPEEDTDGPENADDAEGFLRVGECVQKGKAGDGIGDEDAEEPRERVWSALLLPRSWRWRRGRPKMADDDLGGGFAIAAPLGGTFLAAPAPRCESVWE